MDCASCGLFRGMTQHTAAQATFIRNGRACSSGGRDVCETCWMNGPTESDLMDLDDNLAFWRLDIDTHRSDMVNFMVEFAQYVSSGDNRRKLWSHWGVIWSRSSNDPREKFGWTWCPASPADIKAGGQWAFDPTNRVYGRVMNTICPDLNIRLGWQFPASDETCGDCIEALIGVWLHCKDGWAPYSND
jgi:hypothetical protein